ncbi:AAA family ATPase, partial [bacterium]|nr:AAA family ATPase [bacterium]
MIIGLTGKNASGKGEVANFLEKSSYTFLSLSDVVRDELKSRGEKITRENLIKTANELRKKFGSSVLAERVIEKIEPHGHYVIDSIRNPAEVNALKRLKYFHLLNVESDPEIRFERIKLRNRESDPKSYKEFLELEAKEASGESAHMQQLNAVAETADAMVTNNSSLEELHEQLRQIIRTVAIKSERPSWDEYFMGIAKMVAMRSNCLKRRVGAIIIRDKRIISTGYNGTPRGLKNCNEGGCARCGDLVQGGTNLDACCCSHGEENAIVQAAYHGITTKNSIIYTTFSPCLWCTK